MSDPADIPAVVDPEDVEEGTSLWRDALRRLARNRLAVVGAVLVALIALAALLAPLIAPYSYERQDLALGASPPSAAHWFGSDELGRDLFTRVLYGGRVSMMVGILAAGVSVLIGVVYGSIAGYVGGRVDRLMMRCVDIAYALPFTILVIMLLVFFGRRIGVLFIAIGAVEWLTLSRIVRGEVMALKEREFVEAAVAMGFSRPYIIRRHLIPNVLGVVIVYATLTVPSIMILEAFLSFLGLGVQPPMSSWGLLIADGARLMEEYPWLLIYPGAALAVTLFSLNFLGDGLRDALDPRSAVD